MVAVSPIPNMRRARNWLSLSGVVAALALVLVIVVAHGPREPTYQGKRLSEWLSDTHPAPGGVTVLSDASVSAVREMGTNALPFLMSMMRASDSSLKLQVVTLLSRQHLARIHFDSTLDRNIDGMRGIRALGLAAKPIFRALADMALQADYPGQAINALTYADREVILHFIEALANRDRKIRARAAFALGSLRQAPDLVVPALTERLRDPDPEVRAQAASALGLYGRLAQSAIPLLTEVSHDASLRTSSFAKEALQIIESSLATQGNP